LSFLGASRLSGCGGRCNRCRLVIVWVEHLVREEGYMVSNQSWGTSGYAYMGNHSLPSPCFVLLIPLVTSFLCHVEASPSATLWMLLHLYATSPQSSRKLAFASFFPLWMIFHFHMESHPCQTLIDLSRVRLGRPIGSIYYCHVAHAP
jgi:hypothetical protein